MPIPDRVIIPTDSSQHQIQVTDDGSRTLLRTDTGDSFHSGCGAITETRHVYLDSSGVTERLQSGTPTRVLEVGLGTGMGMLLTVDLARSTNTPLYYTALEIDWITVELLDSLEPHRWGIQSSLIAQYRAFRESLPDQPADGDYAWFVTEDVEVQIQVCDAANWKANSGESKFDAIYFDPFSPESAPDLWTIDVLQAMQGALADHGNLTTYSCSRLVRDRMAAVGLECRRVPGPRPGKREILIASQAKSSDQSKKQ